MHHMYIMRAHKSSANNIRRLVYHIQIKSFVKPLPATAVTAKTQGCTPNSIDKMIGIYLVMSRVFKVLLISHYYQELPRILIVCRKIIFSFHLL